MNLLVKLSTIFLLLSPIGCSHLEEGNSCIIQYLKSKSRIPLEFPYDTPPQTRKCKLIMPVIMSKLETAMSRKLSEREEINVKCIMEHLKNVNGLDYLLMREIIPMSKSVDNSEVTQMTRNTTKILRRILINGANKCKSDRSYYGLFDDILGIQNLSLPVLQQNYCFTRYAIENKLIEVKHVNMNPRRITTANVNCEEMLDVLQVTKERQLLGRLKGKDFRAEQIQCIMDRYRGERAFDSNIALEVIDLLHVSYEEKRANREKIAGQLERYITSVYNCVKSSPDLYDRITENVKILHF